jgi:5-methylcytosine-specific restriction protein A
MAWATPTFGQQRRKHEAARGTNKQRGYDEHWARISRMKRQDNPVCEVCHDAPATEVDHIVAFNGPFDPLRTHWSNLQSICRQCHNRKTHGGNSEQK